DKYTIYLRFYILRKAIRLHESLVSLGITVPKSKWADGMIKGSGFDVRDKNERLRRPLDADRDALHDFNKLNITNAATIKQAPKEGLRLKITSKPKKGQRLQYLSKISEHEISAVKDSYLALSTDLSKTYQKNFRLAV